MAAPANDTSPIPPDEQVWRMCAYMRRADGKRCQRCPEWQHDDVHGPFTRGCRMAAAETVNVAETGSAWRDERKVLI